MARETDDRSAADSVDRLRPRGAVDDVASSAEQEGQLEPGSDGTVLKNLLEIKSVEEIDVRETDALEQTTESVVKNYDAAHRFVAADIRSIHRIWLQEIYAWAGEYRQVNVSKSGFPFASAARIPPLMEAFERGPLRQYTPCAPGPHATVASALAEVHVELVLIHPFREGNGRVARLLSTLMALQAGIPFLYFGMISDERKADYFAAIQAGMDRNYQPMAGLFSEVIEISIGRARASGLAARRDRAGTWQRNPRSCRFRSPSSSRRYQRALREISSGLEGARCFRRVAL